MRIGVVSDTHDRRVNVVRIVELLRGLEVDRVVHTGDITSPATLEVFAALEQRLFGVFGNNDFDREGLGAVAGRHDFDFAPVQELEWAQRRILVVHDPAETVATELDGYDVFLHGHTHRETVELRSGCLVFNPGECAGTLPGRNAIGIVDLVSLETELIRF